MSARIEEFKKYIKDRKVAVLGIGISNVPLIKYLYNLGVDITAFDRADRDWLEPSLRKLGDINIKLCLGENYLSNLKGFDVIFRTPGMRYDIPEIQEECRRGAELTSEMEVFFSLCPAEIIAVTGSDGKTTTTTLIYKILMEQGYNCWLGGNIGIPLLSRVEEIGEQDKVVLELSSFQLHTMKQSPHVAVITNLSPNHLDVHKSMQEYVDAKKNIFLHQHRDDRLIINYDCDLTREFADEARGEVRFFSRRKELENGAFVRDGKIIYKKDGKEIYIADTDDIILPGLHNLENYLAATAATIDYVEPQAIRKIASTFEGVEHRNEFVREVNGVRFYNDSIASSPARTIAGLNSFNQKVILIAGGKDKKIPYDPLGEAILDKVKTLILIGATAPLIEKALYDAAAKRNVTVDIPVIHCTSYEEVVKKAYESASKGDIVYFSPASTSFDMFRNFEERGNLFKELVMKL